MTLRTSLARYVRGLLSEETSTPNGSAPPTPNPVSIPPTTTPTTTTENATSEAGVLAVVMATMERMQRENLREIRGMVSDILQGRPMSEEEIAARTAGQPDPPELKNLYDPPDYDDPGTDDLPEGIQSIFERERQEVADLRHLRTEREVLAAQMAEARAMLMDPQGPAAFEPS